MKDDTDEIAQTLTDYPLLMTSDEVAEVLRCTPKHVTQTILENHPELEVRASEGKRLTRRDRLQEWIMSGGARENGAKRTRQG